MTEPHEIVLMSHINLNLKSQKPTNTSQKTGGITHRRSYFSKIFKMILSILMKF